jgi:hypothetical protein
MAARNRILYLTVVLVALAALGAACSVAKRSTSAPGAAGGAPRLVPQGPVGAGSTQDLGVPQAAPKIVKTADLTVQVARGKLAAQFGAATLVAGRHGGFVSTSQTTQGTDATLASGSLVLRVPADQFDATLADLRSLGTFRDERISGEDVTAHFVDLDARVRNSRAQEAVLLRLMSQSTSIEDSLKVQGPLQKTQLDIEELEGQLRVLSDQTALASINLSLTEAAPVVLAAPKSTFARAWKQSVHGLRLFVDGLIVAMGYVAPFAVIGLVVLAGWLAVRRRSRTAPNPEV